MRTLFESVLRRTHLQLELTETAGCADDISVAENVSLSRLLSRDLASRAKGIQAIASQLQLTAKASALFAEVMCTLYPSHAQHTNPSLVYCACLCEELPHLSASDIIDSWQYLLYAMRSDDKFTKQPEHAKWVRIIDNALSAKYGVLSSEIEVADTNLLFELSSDLLKQGFVNSCRTAIDGLDAPKKIALSKKLAPRLAECFFGACSRQQQEHAEWLFNFAKLSGNAPLLHQQLQNQHGRGVGFVSAFSHANYAMAIWLWREVLTADEKAQLRRNYFAVATTASRAVPTHSRSCQILLRMCETATAEQVRWFLNEVLGPNEKIFLMQNPQVVFDMVYHSVNSDTLRYLWGEIAIELKSWFKSGQCIAHVQATGRADLLVRRFIELDDLEMLGLCAAKLWEYGSKAALVEYVNTHYVALSNQLAMMRKDYANVKDIRAYVQEITQAERKLEIMITIIKDHPRAFEFGMAVYSPSEHFATPPRISRSAESVGSERFLVSYNRGQLSGLSAEGTSGGASNNELAGHTAELSPVRWHCSPGSAHASGRRAGQSFRFR